MQESNDSEKIAKEEEKVHPPISIEVSEATEAPVEHKRKYIKIELTDMYPQKEAEKTTAKRNNKSKRLSIKSVEKSFAKSRSYRDSLYLANAYYKKGNYSKAQKWALITNDLNSKIEESWLIFAKSKAKMGHRKEAEHVLSSYISKTNSSKAKIVLKKIKKGSI
jgi:predicted Zn-dependent protease